MGRHSTGPGDVPGPPSASYDTRSPVTDPVLLDARTAAPRTSSGSHGTTAPAAEAPPSTAPVRTRPAAAPGSTVVQVPWAPRPVVRHQDAPFSGPVAIPDPDPLPPVRPAVQPPTPAQADDDRHQVSSAAPRSLPMLLSERDGGVTGAVWAPPALDRTGRDADGPDARAGLEEDGLTDVEVGFSVRALLLSLGVGLGIAAALSIVAVLPI